MNSRIADAQFDYDYLIIGSGFGGSVSALRLAEKNYRVGVLETGKRYADKDYAKSAWDVRKFLWAPFAGCRGILRMTPFKDVFVRYRQINFLKPVVSKPRSHATVLLHSANALLLRSR